MVPKVEDAYKRRRSVVGSKAALWVAAAFVILYLSLPSSASVSSTSWASIHNLTRKLMSADLYKNEAAFSAPAAVHGWVRKSGPVDLRQWHVNYHEAKAREFRDYIKNWRDSDEDYLDAPSTVIGRCMILVNHKYKFMYVRHRKTGSSSLIDFLTLCEAQNAGQTCMEVLPWNASIPEIERMWRDYFVFTVVRNPYLKALSSYKYLLSRMDANHTCSQNYTWEDFCFDPMSLGDRCRSRGCCFGGPDVFWGHTVGQDRCMLAAPTDASADDDVGESLPPTNNPAWAVDYIARTEHMAEDTVEILAEIDRRRDPGLASVSRPPSEDTGPRVVNQRPSCAEGESGRLEPKRRAKPGGWYFGAVPQEQYCRMEEYFGRRHEGCSAALRHFFKRDFELFYPHN